MRLWTLFKPDPNKDIVKKSKAFVPRLIKAIWLDTLAIEEIKVEFEIKERIPTSTQDTKQEDTAAAFIAMLNKFTAEAKLRPELTKSLDALEVRNVFCELSAFYFHLIDWLAFIHDLGDEKRRIVYTAVLEEFLKKVVSLLGSENREWIDEIFYFWILDRSKEYEAYKKEFPKDNESTEGTLAYEFAKYITKATNMSGHTLFITSVLDQVIRTMDSLEFPKFFSDIMASK